MLETKRTYFKTYNKLLQWYYNIYFQKHSIHDELF